MNTASIIRHSVKVRSHVTHQYSEKGWQC